ncbi:Eukaryotic/viral aspartic protease [Phytophthora megakarya]|uniref:Eukaryotic/viral aspartic protease n=1 Tax=Phytophthora megakarya TaxID=4795 RepID=A0A225VB82_9STRA|nr:Eukaryotic/viral aspartic protease [Phytophthora megakarya]
MGSKDAGRQYTAKELEYELSRTELFRQLERDPILSFIKPKLIGELTGPFHEPDFSKLRSVRLTIQALFAVLRESGFVLRAFEMERVYDWDLESWMNAIYAILDPLTVLVGTVEREATPTQDLDEDETAPETTPSAPRYANPTPTSRRATTETVPQESTDVAMESVSSRPSSNSKRDQDEDLDDLFDLDAGLTGTAAAISTATAGGGVARSAFSELKEFNGKDASEEAWFNRLKSASRRDGMTGDEVCALFGDLMAGPARQWYLQLKKSTRTSWTELTDQFRVQYCGKGVSMPSRYYHASKHVDETPLEYLYRLNEQELASRLVLMEVPDTATLEKKLRARQRGLAHQRKTLFDSNRFRQKAPTPAPTPARAVHAVQIAADDYDSGREEDSDDDQIGDQYRDDGERAKMFVTGHALQQESTCRDFETIDLQPEERRGYWKHYSPTKWYKQIKIHGKLNNRKAVLLLDTGAEVSILDSDFARDIGCLIDTSMT